MLFLLMDMADTPEKKEKQRHYSINTNDYPIILLVNS